MKIYLKVKAVCKDQIPIDSFRDWVFKNLPVGLDAENWKGSETLPEAENRSVGMTVIAVFSINDKTMQDQTLKDLQTFLTNNGQKQFPGLISCEIEINKFDGDVQNEKTTITYPEGPK